MCAKNKKILFLEFKLGCFVIGIKLLNNNSNFAQLKKKKFIKCKSQLKCTNCHRRNSENNNKRNKRRRRGRRIFSKSHNSRVILVFFVAYWVIGRRSKSGGRREMSGSGRKRGRKSGRGRKRGGKRRWVSGMTSRDDNCFIYGCS